jgi:hypothetical protein
VDIQERSACERRESRESRSRCRSAARRQTRA